MRMQAASDPPRHCRTRDRRWYTQALTLLVALLIFLFASPWITAARAETLPPISIGVSGPFTGGSSPMGLSMREGIRIAAENINSRGGVLGRQLELIERDDEASNEVGARAVREMIETDGIVAGLGIVNTGVALASQRYYQTAGLPVITSVATGSLITRQFLPPEHPDNFVFRMSASDTLQAAMIVREVVVRAGLTRVAIFHDATNYGQLGRADLEAALRHHGVVPVAVERFQLAEADMTHMLHRARTAGAQVILTYGIGPELARIANTRARIGWNVPIVGSWTLAMSNFIDDAGPNAEGVKMPQTFIPDPANPAHARFLETWRQRTGSVRIPVPPAAAQGYDSLLLLAAAIEQAGSTHGDRIREALESLEQPVEGVIKVYRQPFSRESHEAFNGNGDVLMGVVVQGRVRHVSSSEKHQ